MALRAFEDQVNNPESQIASHPEQFTLFRIGTYDDQTAEIRTDMVKSLGKAIEYLKQKPENKLQVTIEELIAKLNEDKKCNQ